jgi:hypothetical protein
MNPETSNSYRAQVAAEERAASEAAQREADKKNLKPLLLAVGDTLRANGCLYRVRKVTPKDFIIRRPGVEVPRG